MALVFKRIMMITHNVQFAIDTKRALESLGDYEVTTVTSAHTAIESLENQSHHVVLMDVENLEMPTLDMVKAIRSTQDEIAIILAPNLPDVQDIAAILNVQGVVDVPSPVRQLIPVIEYAVRDIMDNLPETAKAPAIDTLQETVYIETLVDDLLGDDETPYFTSRQVQAQKRSLVDIVEDDHKHNTSPIEVVIDSSSGDDEIRYVESEDEQGNRSLQLFKKLAEEEPPLPNLSQSGTVRDLVRNISQSNQVPLLEVDEEEETEVRLLDDVLEDAMDETVSDSVPAILVLQTALDETTPIEAISLQTLFDNIQNRLPEDKQSIRPLPSWLKESEKFVREPIFLSDELELEYLDSQRPLEYTSTNTQPSDGTVVVSDSGNLETEVIEPESPYVPENFLDDVVADNRDVEGVELESDDDTVEEPIDSDFDDAGNIQSHEEDEAVSEPIDEEVSDSQKQDDGQQAKDDSLSSDTATFEPMPSPDAPVSQPEDPFLAQLAVTLTQVTTELTAEATILTRDNAIVAYSGEMPMEDIDDVRAVINDDWTAGLDNARIRFITLPSSGKDYMLYSKGTVGDFTLSMVFAGTRQLRIIRRQGERLINALAAIPDTDESEVQAPDTADEELDDVSEIIEAPITSASEAVEVDKPGTEPADLGPKLPYTFIWLSKDTSVRLSTSVAKQLVFWLETQLNGLYWTIHKLDVHQDFIYLHADVPGELSPSRLIRNLMERSKKIAHSEDDTLPDNLWADAYLVLTPGREMTDREIQRFLNFARDEV